MRAAARLVLFVAAAAAGCGDDLTGPDAGTGLAIAARTPAPGAAEVWSGAPIAIEFTRPLAPGSISPDTITLTAGGPPLDAAVNLSQDGRTVTAILEQVPPLPAEVTVTVTGGVTAADGERFAGESWSFTLPVWAHAAPGAGDQAAIASGGGATFLARRDGGRVIVERLDGLERIELDQVPLDGAPASAIRLAVAPDGAPVLLAAASDEVRILRWGGEAWQSLGGAIPIEALDRADLAIDAAGRPVAAGYAAGSGLGVVAWDGAAWVAAAPVEPIDAPADLDLVLDGDAPVVAVVSGGALDVLRLEAGAWTRLDGLPEAGEAIAADLAAAGGAVAIAWQSREVIDQVHAARLTATGWQLLGGGAANLELDRAAIAPSIAIAGDGAALLAWSEAGAALVARASGDWQLMDSSPAAARPAGLALDDGGDPVLATVACGGGDGGGGACAAGVARWNRSPSLRYGLVERLPAGDCAIPDEPPTSLLATGCYRAEGGAPRPAPQLVPYAVRAPLWSDGAAKRRFILVPDGQHIDASGDGGWDVPIGTILVKEFLLPHPDDPARLRPVETRFLVRRCEEGDCLEPWQGYSYRWLEDESDAELLPFGEERTDWEVPDGSGGTATHTHIYPSRIQCMRCHNPPAGRVLGLQTAQLNRTGVYHRGDGDGAILDNQLRAMDHIGLFGAGAPIDPAAAPRLPSPLDASQTAEARTRAYLHGNCAQCHRPGGEREELDLRWEAPLADNLCDAVVPGDSAASPLYARDATRGAGQMPPLATDLPDAAQLAVTAAWIDGMVSCP